MGDLIILVKIVIIPRVSLVKILAGAIRRKEMVNAFIDVLPVINLYPFQTTCKIRE